MIYKYSRKQIDEVLWDDCIENCIHPLIYGCTWYLDIICDAWEGIIISNGDKYLAVMPIPVEKKWSITYVRQPLFAHQLGIFRRAEISPEELKSMVNVALESYSYVNPLVLNPDNQFVHSLSNKYLQATVESNLIMDLAQEYDQIQSGYRRDRKKDLKNALKVNQKIIESEDVAPLCEMFDESVVPSFQGGIHPESYRMLQEIVEASKKRGIGHLLYTQYPDMRLGAGVFLVMWKNRIIYLFNACFSEFRSDNGRMLILDQVIRKYQQTDWIFDFESPFDVEEIRTYYASFGAKQIEIPVIKYEHLPAWMTFVRKVRKKLVHLMNS